MLKVNHLCKSYQTEKVRYEVLKNISFEVEKGEFVAVMGPSGSGKTTLLNCISGFLPFEEGEILLGERDIANLAEDELAEVRNENLGFVFQDYMLLDGLSVFENICLPQIIAGRNVVKMEAFAAHLCDVFKITPLKDKFPAEISGGEKQRTAVARALMNNPQVILADEPTGNLDSKSCRTVIESFLQAQRELNATICMVTHDSFAASFCDRVIVLLDGEVYAELKRFGDRVHFLDKLLSVLGEMGGRENDHA